MVVQEHETAPALGQVAGPAGPAADVPAAPLNRAGTAPAAGLNPSRRPEPPLVPGPDGAARRGANGQAGRIAVQAARLPGARRATGAVQHEAARQAPPRLGAGTVVTPQDPPTPTERLLEADQRGHDIILDITGLSPSA